MDKIPSFTVNHVDLLPGVYISRKDSVGAQILTTFDLRMTRPNIEPVMDTAAVHALEHLGATFLRNHTDWKERVIYFGPMGCRTGFYLILQGDLCPANIIGLLREMFAFIVKYEGEIPGASPRDCGNYLDLNLSMAQFHARRYLQDVLEIIRPEQTVYPD